MQDDGHRKSSYAAPSNRGTRLEQSCRQGDETGEEQQVVQDTEGHRTPAYATALVAQPNTVAKK